jgi:hypothetical protein
MGSGGASVSVFLSSPGFVSCFVLVCFLSMYNIIQVFVIVMGRLVVSVGLGVHRSEKRFE